MIGGIDEAGRGPVLGSLVVAGVLFKDDSELLKATQTIYHDSKHPFKITIPIIPARAPREYSFT